MNERVRAIGSLSRHGWEWWWDRRLRIADWLYALLPLPFSMLLQLGSTDREAAGVLSGALSLLLETMLAVTPLLAFFVGIATTIVPALLAAGFTLLRRTRPQWLLGLSFLLLAGFGNIFPAVVALYSYAVYSTNRRLVTAWGVMMALAIALAYPSHVATQLFLDVVFLVTPLLFGLWVGTRRQLIDRLQERAERLEREQHLKAEQATTAERTRIAREMHDVVAHRVSLMVLHAGGLEVSSTDEHAVETAGVIRTTGREALAELRSILGVLRDKSTESAPTAPQPVLADLNRLLEEWRGVGMKILHEETGDQIFLPTSVQRTVFRVVQEGLTNAAKHAHGATVTVGLHHRPDRIEVEVANGPPPTPSEPPPHSGFGLTGLRERLALVGGELTVGACPDGGWRMRAMVPIEEQAPTTEDEEPAGDPNAPDR